MTKFTDVINKSIRAMKENLLINLFKEELEEKSSIKFSYRAFVKDYVDYIEVSINGKPFKDVKESQFDSFLEVIAKAYESMKVGFKSLNISRVSDELHWLHSGYNFTRTARVINLITTKDVKVKTGVVTESYSLIGKNDVMNVIAKYPNYELYLRCGYAFRGAREGKVALSRLQQALERYAAFDVEVKDGEIHVNAFSTNDLY